jgi:hypothetical protein
MRFGKWGAFGAVLCVCAVLTAALAAGTGAASASAASGHRARTKVTIASWPDGVFGYVNSSNAACESGRKIELFRETKPGGPARRVNSETAARSQRGYEWLAETAHGDTYYAVAEATSQCTAATSRALSVSSGADLPRCPDTTDGKCVLVINAMESRLCYSFSDEAGYCQGTTSGDVNQDWSSRTRAEFSWRGAGGRSVNYSAWYTGETFSYVAWIFGYVPGASSADLMVSDAYPYDSRFHFYTPDKPGVLPGRDGGPLYLNFDSPSFPSSTYHIIIWGTLYACRSVSAGKCVR